MSINDLGTVFDLGSKYILKSGADSPDWNAKNLSDILSNSLDLSFIAVRKKDILGFLIGTNSENKSYNILWLLVMEKYKEKGIEDALYNYLLNEISALSINKIVVQIKDNKDELINLYKKYGFTETNQISTLEHNLPKQ